MPTQFHSVIKGAADASFITAFNEILLIAAFVALVGSVLGFLMVRGDFVGPAQPASSAPATRETVPAG